MIPKVAGVFLCLVMGVMQFLLHCFILPRSALGQHSILNWVICKVVSEVKKSDPNSVPRLDDFLLIGRLFNTFAIIFGNIRPKLS